MSVTHAAPQASVVKTRTDQANEIPQTTAPTTPVGAVLGRLTWMLFGPFVLVLSTIALFSKNVGFFSLADFIYFAALGATLLGRRAEVRSGHGLTAEGAPVTAQHLRRYLLWTTAVGVGIWASTVVFRVCS